MTGLKVACHATPMFHAMGVFQTLWAVRVLNIHTTGFSTNRLNL